jgi:hypothetical protein
MPTRKRKKWDSYEDYLKSLEWEQIRKEVHRRDDETCRLCESSGSNIELHCHHFRYPKDWSDDSSENVMLACADCHDTIHNKYSMDATFESAEQFVIAFLRHKLPDAYEEGQLSNTDFVNLHIVDLLSSNVKSYGQKMSVVIHPEQIFLIDGHEVPKQWFNEIAKRVTKGVGNG